MTDIRQAKILILATDGFEGSELTVPQARTSYASIRSDVINAGARWHDEAVVTDQGIITSRDPGDLDAFCAKIVAEIREGGHGTRQLAA